jgi:DHA3 family tetracycline resistance protein-like MFS transporter
LVLIGTVMELTIFFCEIPTGVVADVISRRLSFIIGIFMMGVAYVLQGTIPVFEALLFAQVVWGLGYTFTSGAYDAWMVDELGEERMGEAFIRSGQVGRIAGLGGIVLSGIFGSIDLRLPIILGALITLGTGVFLVFTMPETGFKPTPREDRTTFQNMRDTFVEGLRVVRSRPVLIRILLIGFFYGLYSEAWDRLWQAHLINNIGFPQFIVLPVMAWFTAIALAETFIGIVSAEVLKRRLDMTDDQRMKRALLYLTIVMVASLVLYGLTQNFLVGIAAFFAFTVSRGLVGPIYATWSNQNIDSNVRATVLSMQSQTDAIGQIAGGPPLGALGQRSLPLAFIASAAILSPVLAFLRGVPQKPALMEN